MRRYPPLIEDDSDNEGDDDNNIDGVPPPSLRRSGRQNRGVPTLRYDDVNEAAFYLMCPTTMKEAFGGEQAEKWALTMDNELESPWKSGVYVEVAKPDGKKVIGNEWVLRIKTDVASNINKYKAEVVAKGYEQVEGIDCDETFAPIICFESIRTWQWG